MRPLLRYAWIPPVAIAVLILGGYTVLQLQPHTNPSGQAAADPNERCTPSPCGAPAGFEADVTQFSVQGDRLVLMVAFRNHTKPQLFEAVSFRHTSPADFTLQVGSRKLSPIFNEACPSWPELDVNRGSISSPRMLCFAVGSAEKAVLVWNPDLGFISQPVSIPLG
jgi:hypothetical protein